MLTSELMTVKQVSELILESEANLARRRVEGTGPRFVKLGTGRQAKIRYRKSAVEEWIASREFSSTSERTCVEGTNQHPHWSDA